MSFYDFLFKKVKKRDMINSIIRKDRKRCKFMSKKTIKKKKKKVEHNDSWMFAMLLSVICILAIALSSFHFHLLNTSLSFSIFVIPVVIFTSNYITKEYGFSDSLKSILIACLIIVAFSMLIKDLVNQKLVLFDILLPFIIYFVSLFVNLAIYYYDLINFGAHKILTYLNYVFTFAVYYLFYLLYFHNYTITNNFWKEYFISIGAGALIAIFGVYIDSKIKRGLDVGKKRKK